MTTDKVMALEKVVGDFRGIISAFCDSEASTLDLDSPAFKVFFRRTVEAFKSAMLGANLGDKVIQRVMNRLSDIMDDGWETDLKAEIQNKVREV